MGKSKDARKGWGGHFWIKVLRLEFQVPNFSVTRVEKKVWRHFNEKKVEATCVPQRKQCPYKNEVDTRN